MAHLTIKGRRVGGFTLIELMIVVAIIAVLASVAIPKFADLVRRSQEGAIKGGMGALRSAMSIYYSDMEGQFPNVPDGLTVNGKYLTQFPVSHIPPYHPSTTGWLTVAGVPGGACDTTLNLSEGGAWVYCTVTSQPLQYTGTITVTYHHTDSLGTIWTYY